MSKEEKPPHTTHNVIIRGTVEGYDVASLEDLKKFGGNSKATGRNRWS